MVSTFDLRVTEHKQILLINNNGAKTGTNDTTEVGQRFGGRKGSKLHRIIIAHRILHHVSKS